MSCALYAESVYPADLWGMDQRSKAGKVDIEPNLSISLENTLTSVYQLSIVSGQGERS